MLGKDVTSSFGLSVTEMNVSSTFPANHKINSNVSSFADWIMLSTGENFTLSATTVGAMGQTVPHVVNSALIFQVFAIVIGFAAIVPNSFVLFIMFYYKLATKNITNVLILNQTILDIVASFGLALNMLIQISGLLQKSIGNVTLAGSWLLCLAFGSAVIFTSPIYAAQTNLMVITIERYVKIVHPFGHREHFRGWMVKVGVILPWISGAALYLIPAWASTRINNGVCMPFQFPSRQLFDAYATAPVVYLFVLPLAVFCYCYGKIIAVLRHQSQVMAASENQTAAVTQPTASMQAGSSTNDKDGHTTIKVSKSQKKVIKTTLIITICYFICWFPVTFYQMATIEGFLVLQPSILFALAAVAYLNVLLNPLIYAAHFDAMKKFFVIIVQLLRSDQ